METFQLMLALSPNSQGTCPAPTAVAVRALDSFTLLLVEDQDFIASYLTEIFTRAGLAVLRADDGASAVKILAEKGTEVRVAMVDHGLPDMSGDELCARLRELVPRLPVMLTSGRDIEECRQKLAESGPTWFVSKPYGITQLVEQVRALRAAAA